MYESSAQKLLAVVEQHSFLMFWLCQKEHNFIPQNVNHPFNHLD